MGQFYCSLCDTSHHDQIKKIQCPKCARFYCIQSIDSLNGVGEKTCPYCGVTLEVSSDKRVEDWIEKARTFMKQSDVVCEAWDFSLSDMLLRKALDNMQEAIRADPENIDAWVLTAHILSNLDDSEEYKGKAIKAINKAVSLNPESSKVWYEKGWILESCEQHDKSLDAFSKALTLDKNNLSAWIDRGHSLRELKRFSEALESYERALEISPNNPKIAFSKSLCLIEMGKKKDAMKVFDQVFQLDPDDIDVLGYKVHILIGCGKRKEALKITEQILKNDPANINAWNLKILALGSKEYQESKQAMEKHEELRKNLHKELREKLRMELEETTPEDIFGE